jgi:hypothetical protein
MPLGRAYAQIRVFRARPRAYLSEAIPESADIIEDLSPDSHIVAPDVAHGLSGHRHP